MGRQNFDQFEEGGIRVIGDGLANFFFVGGEFQWGAGFVDFGSKTPGVTPPLEKRIHPSGTD